MDSDFKEMRDALLLKHGITDYMIDNIKLVYRMWKGADYYSHGQITQTMWECLDAMYKENGLVKSGVWDGLNNKERLLMFDVYSEYMEEHVRLADQEKDILSFIRLVGEFASIRENFIMKKSEVKNG